nr:MAG TPA: vacuolar transporter [Caudoviricetes sp.]
MEIDKFIEKVNEHDGMRAKKVDKNIMVGTPNNMGIFYIPEDATNFIEIDTWATSNSLYWKKPDREYLSALIEEFLHTPIKERFPEKKYRLRWFDDDNGAKNYVKFKNGEWCFYDIHFSDAQYTNKELEQLKRGNPKLAPAIDVMKEPAEE